MKTRGKNINLFLMDGVPNGRIKCTLANWTGVAYRIPRTELDKCYDRDDLKQSGVYFLFGVSDYSDEDIVYIGQAGLRKSGEGILYRIQEHKKSSDKDYWTEAVIFTTSNNSFGPTEISYLENRFYDLAKKANRYTVKNSVYPNPGHVTEEKESELEEFIEYSKIVIGTLGYRVLESLEDNSKKELDKNTDSDNEPLLFIKGKNANAKGRVTNEGFVVYKGSIVETSPTKSCRPTTKNLRNKYKDRIKDGVLIEDTLFKSPSAASSFVRYASTNGLFEWKNEENRSLGEIEKCEY